jgi:hypothetical protein
MSPAIPSPCGLLTPAHLSPLGDELSTGDNAGTCTASLPRSGAQVYHPCGACLRRKYINPCRTSPSRAWEAGVPRKGPSRKQRHGSIPVLSATSPSRTQVNRAAAPPAGSALPRPGVKLEQRGRVPGTIKVGPGQGVRLA